MENDNKIYRAQTIGNIEPIEYMIPYPSVQAIIEGQIIKYHNETVFEEYGLSNIEFYYTVQKISCWLNEQGINPKDRVIITDNSILNSILLLYGLWNIGAVGVFLEQKNACKNKNLNTKTLNYEGDLIKRIQLYTPKFIPKYKALLNEDAIAIVSSDKTVFISHYALLINASGLQKLLNLRSKQRFFCDLNPGTSFWVVICAILPVYSLATFTSFNPSVVITFENIDINKGYRLRKDWEKLDDYKLNDLAVCKENSAIFAINKKPIHLTDYKIIDDELWLKGHSLMNGYLEKDKMVFKDDYLIIKKNKF